ncbi:hypothetical protein Vretimale_9272 [Volvox reticuliferus]|uniref:Uncharacterized protein n=1 Tax=Volvox reticuliferus TaxID=1737510 RepID=A0A8J4LP50_9CHLO|nr:hypothetical protein Vretimale_9272 [Volvox reticuliferus]
MQTATTTAKQEKKYPNCLSEMINSVEGIHNLQPAESLLPAPTIHDRLAAERHVPRPVPSLGLEDAGTLDLSEVAAAAGLSPEEADQLWREAQDEVLAELKGEVIQRQASDRVSEEGSPTRVHHRQHRRHCHDDEEEPNIGFEGALIKFARVAAAERHETVRQVLEALSPVHVDIERLDSKKRDVDELSIDATAAVGGGFNV